MSALVKRSDLPFLKQASFSSWYPAVRSDESICLIGSRGLDPRIDRTRVFVAFLKCDRAFTMITARLISASLMTPRGFFSQPPRLKSPNRRYKKIYPHPVSCSMNYRLRFHGDRGSLKKRWFSHTECFSFRSEGPGQFRGIDTQRLPLPVLPTVLRKVVERTDGTIMTKYPKEFHFCGLLNFASN